MQKEVLLPIGFPILLAIPTPIVWREGATKAGTPALVTPSLTIWVEGRWQLLKALSSIGKSCFCLLLDLPHPRFAVHYLRRILVITSLKPEISNSVHSIVDMINLHVIHI